MILKSIYRNKCVCASVSYIYRRLGVTMNVITKKIEGGGGGGSLGAIANGQPRLTWCSTLSLSDGLWRPGLLW